MVPNRATRFPATGCVLAICTALALQGCASHYVAVPPRLDLQPHGTVALVAFTATPGHERLATVATERFVEEALSNQPGVELVELRPADLGLAGPLSTADGEAIAEAVRRRHQVSAVFVGDLSVTSIKPRGGFGAVGSGVVGAEVEAALAVRLVSLRSGGTLWRARSAASGSVGRASVTGGLPAVSVRDPNEAYAEVVDEVVFDVTRDLRPTRVRQ